MFLLVPGPMAFNRLLDTQLKKAHSLRAWSMTVDAKSKKAGSL
jgi:hypothetical protein